MAILTHLGKTLTTLCLNCDVIIAMVNEENVVPFDLELLPPFRNNVHNTYIQSNG